MDFYDRLNNPEVRDFFPQGFFAEEIEDYCDLVRTEQAQNEIWTHPFFPHRQPRAIRHRSNWMREYWRALEKKPIKYGNGQSSKTGKTGDNFPAKRLFIDAPMVHNHRALRCGNEYYVHINGVRYTRLDREKLSQIVVAMHLQGYVKVDTGYYMLTRGRYERTVRFHECTINPMKAWVVSAARN